MMTREGSQVAGQRLGTVGLMLFMIYDLVGLLAWMGNLMTRRCLFLLSVFVEVLRYHKHDERRCITDDDWLVQNSP